MTRPDYLAVGRIGRAHGIQGEVQVDVLTDFPEASFVPGRTLHVGAEGDPAPRPHEVASVRTHRSRLLVSFRGIATRTEAERLTGLFAQIPLAEAQPLPEGEFFAHEVIGLTVVTADGRPLGRVVEVLETGANDVLRVAGAREVLVPFIDDVVVEVDPEGGRLVVRALPGLLEDSAAEG